MKLSCLFLSMVLVSSAAVAFGQIVKPVVLNRVPPPAQAVPSPVEYPFTEMLRSAKAAPAATPPTMRASSVPEDSAPETFEMKNIALTPTAADAVALAKTLVNERNTPTPSADGRVVYLYGVGLPTIVCAPLRVCSLELQAGEHILGEPQIGDSVRWEVSPAISGVDANAIPILVLKPKMTGLDTTMLILTDKRTYYIRLISKPEEFIARTAFSYSDDEHVQWKVFLAEQERARTERVASSQVAVAAKGAIDRLYFDYTIKPSKGSETIVPDRVMDDGEKTYIQMPAVAMYRELPALVIQGPTGNEMVNYRVKDNTYIVDRLFDRAALLMGSGRHQQIVKLARKQPLADGGK